MPNSRDSHARDKIQSSPTFNMTDYWTAVEELVTEAEQKATDTSEDPGFQEAINAFREMANLGKQLETVLAVNPNPFSREESLNSLGNKIMEVRKAAFRNTDQILRITGPASLRLAEGYLNILKHCLPDKLTPESSRLGTAAALLNGLKNYIPGKTTKSGYQDFTDTAQAISREIEKFEKEHPLEQSNHSSLPESTTEEKPSTGGSSAPAIEEVHLNNETPQQCVRRIQEKYNQAEIEWRESRKAYDQFFNFLIALGWEDESERAENPEFPSVQNTWIPDEETEEIKNDKDVNLNNDKDVNLNAATRAIEALSNLQKKHPAASLQRHVPKASPDIIKRIQESPAFKEQTPQALFGAIAPFLSPESRARWTRENTSQYWSYVLYNYRTNYKEDRLLLEKILHDEMLTQADKAHTHADSFSTISFSREIQDLQRQKHREHYQDVLSELKDGFESRKLKHRESSVPVEDESLKTAINECLRKHGSDPRMRFLIMDIAKLLGSMKPKKMHIKDLPLVKIFRGQGTKEGRKFIIENIAYQAICAEAIRVLKMDDLSAHNLENLEDNICLTQRATNKELTLEDQKQLQKNLENPSLHNRFRGFCAMIIGLFKNDHKLFMQGLASIKSGYDVTKAAKTKSQAKGAALIGWLTLNPRSTAEEKDSAPHKIPPAKTGQDDEDKPPQNKRPYNFK